MPVSRKTHYPLRRKLEANLVIRCCAPAVGGHAATRRVERRGCRSPRAAGSARRSGAAPTRTGVRSPRAARTPVADDRVGERGIDSSRELARRELAEPVTFFGDVVPHHAANTGRHVTASAK